MSVGFHHPFAAIEDKSPTAGKPKPLRGPSVLILPNYDDIPYVGMDTFASMGEIVQRLRAKSELDEQNAREG